MNIVVAVVWLIGVPIATYLFAKMKICRDASIFAGVFWPFLVIVSPLFGLVYVLDLIAKQGDKQ